MDARSIGSSGGGQAEVENLVEQVLEKALWSQPQVKIYIDGALTSEIGLHDPRQKMSIIPQDPVLFTDSTRKSSSSWCVCPQQSSRRTASRSSTRPC
ncbi:ATP-binding cassette sub-family C member 2-like [Sebastes fasciatus]|uniref:ATP-binding cassette sub-family C member 2-like n=1 Tax=Sebastes fasciatus TaxID=394691 RepID=UPI003D9EB05F